MLEKTGWGLYIKTNLYKYKYILILLIIYFFFRLINLKLLPIFNDEAIYLDWGWREIYSGNLYYSLYDAKQPLLMWIFGVFETFLPDPLFAGRLVSVFLGALTLTGLYKIGKQFFSSYTAILAALLYIVIPIFSFYDRQALMESAIGAVDVWAGYFIFYYLQKPKKKYAAISGLILGTGFFIKSTSILFLFSIICVFILKILLDKKNRKEHLQNILILLGVFFTSIFLLLINPQFWQTLPSNSRYALTIPELMLFPVYTWIKNIFINGEILFFFLTPFIFIFVLIGFYLNISSQSFQKKIFIFYAILPLLFQILLVKDPSQRYIVSILPLFCIISAYGFINVFKRKILVPVLLVALFVPFIISCIQILNPIQYFDLYSKVTKYSDKSGYVSGMSSGYGVNQTVDEINSLSKNKPIIVGIALNSGIPESAIIVYFLKNEKVTVTYIDQLLYGDELKQVDCFTSDKPAYFISRNIQLAGLNKFLVKFKDVHDKNNPNYIGIYRFINGCQGKSLDFPIVPYP